ncbi:hypothetical protein OEZ85_011628 [Tetradesmus obliquus]|uniref:CAAX prenyl protease 2/Lysostaphin resistance protein A-like domain-containing protein n=1 Tax=Tetradesmus obliquus TaxID=3088 RepID=A0ABY8TQY6_TETOB|nr:hypothetical protein OEZ85_011628 [Tetradesmus obliquus]
MLLHTRPCGLSFRPTSATSRQARQVAAAAAKKQKPQKKKLRKPKQPVQQRIYMNYELDEDEENEQDGMVQSVLLPGVAVPSAPAPASGPRERPLEPEELYAVFPKQQQPSVTALPPGKWNWGEGGNPAAAAAAAAAAGQAQQQDTPMWNPKTGFMKTREQIEQEAAAAAAAAASSSSQPALLTGVSEEFLFRGGLVPLTWPDYRGVLLSGVVFGVLHVGGGRNAAFAAWATAVGWLYGGVFLASGGNVWVPAGAHALANFASAAVWMSKNGGGSSGSDAKQGTGQDTK